MPALPLPIIPPQYHFAMVSLTDHPRLRLAFLCLLYGGQGIPYGFVTVALAAHPTARGATAAVMTISQAALLRKPNRVSDGGGATPRFFRTFV